MWDLHQLGVEKGFLNLNQAKVLKSSLLLSGPASLFPTSWLKESIIVGYAATPEALEELARKKEAWRCCGEKPWFGVGSIHFWEFMWFHVWCEGICHIKGMGFDFLKVKRQSVSFIPRCIISRRHGVTKAEEKRKEELKKERAERARLSSSRFGLRHAANKFPSYLQLLYVIIIHYLPLSAHLHLGWHHLFVG